MSARGPRRSPSKTSTRVENVPSGPAIVVVDPIPGDHTSVTGPGGKPVPVAPATNPGGPRRGLSTRLAPGVGGGMSTVGGTVTGVVVVDPGTSGRVVVVGSGSGSGPGPGSGPG